MIKYLISPTKTMRVKVSDEYQEPLLKKHAEPLIKRLTHLSLEQLKDHFKLSDKLAQTLYHRLQSFDPVTPAIYAYQGQQFKALDADTLNEDALSFAETHVHILSGLYGLLRPLDSISTYRLPLDEGLPEAPVIDYWKAHLEPHLTSHTLINLSSKEYSQLLSGCEMVIDVDFVAYVNGRAKRSAMTLKTLRGYFLRYVIDHRITDLEALKNFEALGYTFDAFDENQLRFVKKNTRVLKK